MPNKIPFQTQESITLLKIAEEIVQTCPAKLGEEIVVLGSVGSGHADEYSGAVKKQAISLTEKQETK